MLKIEIKSSQTRERKGTSERNGKPYHFFIQEAWAHVANAPYPQKIELTWNTQVEVAQVGFYELAPESIYVNRNNKLTLNPILVAVQPAKSSAA